MPDEKRKQARELWEQSGGTLPLSEIAEKLDVPLATIKSWKRRDGWGKDARMRTDAKDASDKQKNASRMREARANTAIAKAVDRADDLSETEKEFCLHFVQCYNAAQAAWRTGRYTTYASAKSAGHTTLQKPAVQEEIKHLKVMKRASILADADDLVELHMRIAFASMGDYAEWGYVNGRNQVGVKVSTDVDTQIVKEVSESAQGFKIKLRDADVSMAFLERFFMANPLDRHKIEFDKKRLELEDRQVKVQEDKLHGLSSDMDSIKEGLQGIMDIINSPVPDRGLDDE